MSQLTLSLIRDAVDELARRLTALEDRLDEKPVSVMLDGSFVRGDFLVHASDLDMTVTFSDAADAQSIRASQQRIQSVPADVLGRLPAREWPRKPLHVDFQWQTVGDIVATAGRRDEEWTADAVPPGYPKLWLYAFDVIEHHRIIVGDDLTSLYTRREPAFFVPVRLERLRRSCLKAGAEPTTYDKEHSTITQMKNAWEAMRAVQLRYGTRTIHKREVIANWRKVVPDFPGKETGDRIWGFYCGDALASVGNSAALIDAFRKQLHHFTLDVVSRFAE